VASAARALCAAVAAAAVLAALVVSGPASGARPNLCAGIPVSLPDRLQLPACGIVERLPGAPARAGSCRWTSPPVRRGRIVAAGGISCPGAGRCSERRLAGGGPWLGGRAAPVDLRCADGRRVTVQLVAVGLADRTGNVCTAVTPIEQRLLRFEVPGSWGGRLVVLWALGAAAPNGTPVSLQVEGAVLPLSGRASGCLPLSGAGNPIP
jgi:hypothetical protein